MKRENWRQSHSRLIVALDNILLTPECGTMLNCRCFPKGTRRPMEYTPVGRIL